MSERKDKKWHEVESGAVILEPGNTLEYKTGSWRMGEKPIWKEESCIQCLICWISCPDKAFFVSDSKITGINYDYCKGCGICTVECPSKPKSLEMVLEEVKIG